MQPMQQQAIQQPQVTPVQKPEAANVADPPPLFPPVKRRAPRIERNSDDGEAKENEKNQCRKCCIIFAFFAIFAVVVIVVVTVVFGGDDEGDSDCSGLTCDFFAPREDSSYDAYSVFETDGPVMYYTERCYDINYKCEGGRTCSMFEDRC